MGRRACCAKEGLNRGAWSAREDTVLTDYIKLHGEGKWRDLPQRAGLKRCGKSCRLRWLNYLRPGIKRGNITEEEEELIIRLHKLLGNRWSLIAGRIPGRTDNEIKNYWNTNLSKRVNDNRRSRLGGPTKDRKPKSIKKPTGGPTKPMAEGLPEPPAHQVIRAKATRFTRTININVVDPRRQSRSPTSLEVNDGCNSEENNGSPSFYSSGINEDHHLLPDFDMDMLLSKPSGSNFDHQTDNSVDGVDCDALVGGYFEDDDTFFTEDDNSAFDHQSFAKFLTSEVDWNVWVDSI